MSRRTRLFHAAAIAAVVGAGLTACTGATVGGGALAPMAQLEAATVVATDKTIGDHLVSFYSGKDCSTVRTQLGLTYCEEDMPEVRVDTYCYRSLGKITCYREPLPDGQPVGRNVPPPGRRR